MPKMKTHSGCKKRFGVTSRGKVKARAAGKRHLMTNKSKGMKMEGRSTMFISEPDSIVILENYLPYSRCKRRKRGTYAGKAQEAQ